MNETLPAMLNSSPLQARFGASHATIGQSGKPWFKVGPVVPDEVGKVYWLEKEEGRFQSRPIGYSTDLAAVEKEMGEYDQQRAIPRQKAIDWLTRAHRGFIDFFANKDLPIPATDRIECYLGLHQDDFEGTLERLRWGEILRMFFTCEDNLNNDVIYRKRFSDELD